MKVFGQFIIADLDKKKSMFDFTVHFFILDPEHKMLQAFYFFDKNSKAPKGVDPDKLPKDQIEVFKGPMDADVNSGKPFAYDALTGKGVGKPVEAQVSLELFSKSKNKFRITVALTKTKSHSVDMTFDGDKPSWLPDSGAPFLGTLVLTDVKIPGP